jgi:hypothetical protein
MHRDEYVHERLDADVLSGPPRAVPTFTKRAATIGRLTIVAGLVLIATACGADGDAVAPPDVDRAPRASIDRFSDAAGTLFRRAADPALPGVNRPIDLDQGPFITQGLGPTGQHVRYYNFDVMPEEPAPIYVLFPEGSDQPVAGQSNIVDAIPGEDGYSDFWRVIRVTVPRSYVANSITSLAGVVAAGYRMEATPELVNCPIVPEGSTAREGGGASGLTRGWYKGMVVFYLNFGEAPLRITEAGAVPLAPIFVTFNINPGDEDGGAASGFRTEPGTLQTHNVIAAIPGQAAYSPFWSVTSYDNADFDDVGDLASAQGALLFGVEGFVNCPVVFVE